MAKKHDKRATTFRTVVIFVIIFIVGSFALVRLSERREDTSDLRGTLAQCLSGKGAVMYGAYWCPNCANQKKDFGSAFKDIDYVECAIPGNPKAQTQECQDAGIEGYPTWDFGDSGRLVGRQQLDALAEKAGCPWGDQAMTGDVMEAAPAEGEETMVGDTGAADDGTMQEPVDGSDTP